MYQRAHLYISPQSIRISRVSESVVTFLRVTYGTAGRAFMRGSAFNVEVYAIGSLRLHIKVNYF